MNNNFTFQISIPEQLFDVLYREKSLQEKISNEKITINEFIEKTLIEHFEISAAELSEDSKDIENFSYYVYTYMDPDKPGPYKYYDFEFSHEPFYIGKGTTNRMYNHTLNDSNALLSKKLKDLNDKGIKPIIVKLIENLNNSTAHKIETSLIKSIGQLINNEGPLTNIFSQKKTTDDLNLNELLKANNSFSYEKILNKLILHALNNSKTLREASTKLQISERTLYRKIESLKIKKVNNEYVFL